MITTMKNTLILFFVVLAALTCHGQTISNPVWSTNYLSVVLQVSPTSQLLANGLPAFTGLNGRGLTNCSFSFYTNFSLNTPFTNSSLLTMRMTVPVIVTEPATTLGYARISVFTSAPGGGWFSVGNCEISGGITSVLQTNQSVLTIQAGPGMAWAVSNSVAGAGYTAGFDLTATNQVTFSP